MTFHTVLARIALRAGPSHGCGAVRPARTVSSKTRLEALPAAEALIRHLSLG
jgi:hypothetical protein